MINRAGGTMKEEIQAIVDRAVEEIVAAVHRGIVASLTPGNGAELASNYSKHRVLAAATGTNGHTEKAKRAPIYCPVAGCRKPGGGPKWGWFCGKHKDLPEKQKAAARASRGEKAE